ncbi:long-chain acyl-CoA synthetase (AMP-forming) [Desulfuromonas soudanensis]|uniref:Long-chain acyl-CoA synthetase (AMP-forming) n=1 Tax=Desulfuromonas soudanensis TaxID=1603606 RepID=A0A0M3QF77_9BACT|nr:long-chain fatty acid--CoA ligase [Desulfuromonas soudanensis]ALC15739.1 long-chain acyl-CoA synthetase (AMP-forming) [Desulfuromonas soudanensis]
MSDTLARMVFNQARRFGGRTALRRKEGGSYRDIPWADVESSIRAYALALLAGEVAPGDRVAIMAPNAPEWLYADMAAMACGALSVPVYHTEGIDTLLHILRDSESRLLFLYSPLLATELAEHLDALPDLEKVVLLIGEHSHPSIFTLKEFLQEGRGENEAELEERLAAGDPEKPASIVYTSGTTGLPKGVVLSHRNFLSNIEACLQLFDIGPNDQCLSFLPLSHVFERMAGYYLMLHQGTVIAYAENFDSVPHNLAEIGPTVVISVPRLYEKMYARIMERVLAGSMVKKQLFFGALKACRSLVRTELSGDSPSLSQRLLAKISRAGVFSKLKTPLGGKLRFFVSGGAPLGAEIAEFFLAAGIPIYEGYGLTETSPVIAANTPEALRLGTVGRPIPGTEVRIADDGEILVKGPGVFAGYWKRPEETAEAFVDGWFKTGDIGEIDADGFLAITDRKKDLIVTAGGENVAPQNIENLLKTDKYIANSMVYGDKKPFLTALLVPNFDNLEKYARYKKIDFLNHCDLVSHPRVLDLVRRRVDALQQNRPSFGRVKRFTLLSRDFSGEEGEVTPTLKVKRKVVAKHFHKVLDDMYLPQDHAIHDSGFCVIERAPTTED